MKDIRLEIAQNAFRPAAKAARGKTIPGVLCSGDCFFKIGATKSAKSQSLDIVITAKATEKERQAP